MKKVKRCGHEWEWHSELSPLVMVLAPSSQPNQVDKPTRISSVRRLRLRVLLQTGGGTWPNNPRHPLPNTQLPTQLSRAGLLDRRQEPHTRSFIQCNMGQCTEYYPLSARFVTFRYDWLVTVPGKGGRPRKWASDADRMRAFRARLNGTDEPATVEESIDQGTQSGRAWAQVRELNETVNEQRAIIQSLERVLKSARRSLVDQERRFSWLDSENERLRAQLEDRRVTRVVSVRTEAPEPTVVPDRAASAPALNRAQRRAAERRMR